MTPAQWKELFNEPYLWQRAQAAVAVEAKAILSAFPDGTSLTTPELVEKLYPETTARGIGLAIRGKLFRVLRGCIKHHAFDGWVDATETKRMYGRERAVYRWHKNGDVPARKEVQCPVCDHKFTLGSE